ncbi:uncharacterized protein TNCV_2221611 [Trichonephila clavipes]|nr:uncharacterized protein TNCV_2221611 [Trichonephila clavipes]
MFWRNSGIARRNETGSRLSYDILFQYSVKKSALQVMNERSFSVDQQPSEFLVHFSSLSPAKVEVKVPMREGMRKGPLTAINLQLMVTKFEETGSLNVRSGRGRKPVSAEAIEKVALQVEEDKASNVQGSTSVRLVAEALDLPRSTVQKIMRNILHYYPYKLQLVQELLPHDFETRHLFSLQFLARLEVDPE